MWRLLWSAVLILGLLVAAACGGTDEGGPAYPLHPLKPRNRRLLQQPLRLLLLRRLQPPQWLPKRLQRPIKLVLLILVMKPERGQLPPTSHHRRKRRQLRARYQWERTLAERTLGASSHPIPPSVGSFQALLLRSRLPFPLQQLLVIPRPLHQRSPLHLRCLWAPMWVIWPRTSSCQRHRGRTARWLRTGQRRTCWWCSTGHSGERIAADSWTSCPTSTRHWRA